MGFISAPGPMELIVILVIALIVLGPKRLPEAARSLGKGMREMKSALQGNDEPDRLEEEKAGQQTRP
jgi:sec-independent protein translocase protein TatA